LSGLAVLFADAEVVLGVLMKILRGHGVAADRRLAGEGDVALEYLIGAAADFEVGAVAVEGLISLRCSVLLLEWPLAVKARAGADLISFFPGALDGISALPGSRSGASQSSTSFGRDGNVVDL